MRPVTAGFLEKTLKRGVLDYDCSVLDMPRLKSALKYLMAVVFTLAGANHFVRTSFYVRIMPPYLPWHVELVYVSGFFEMALGISLLVPRLSRFSAWGLIGLLIAVFPANIHMAVHSDLYPAISPVLLWIRLPLQGVLVAWAYWFTRDS
jgi:uncharacterized membrane protein